jgi:hypothetical protein
MAIEVLCTSSILAGLRQQGGARGTSSPRIKGRRFEAAQVQLHRTLRVPGLNDASCTTLQGQRDSACETRVLFLPPIFAEIAFYGSILWKYEAIITPSSFKLLRFVGIDIPDLPAWLSNWVGHVISMLGTGDRPAAPFHPHRIYTLLHHVEPLCTLPV